MSTTTVEEHVDGSAIEGRGLEEHSSDGVDLESHSSDGVDLEKHNSSEGAAADTPSKAAPPSGPPPLYLPREAYLSLVGGWIALFFGFGFINAFGVFETYYKQVVIPASSDSTISWIGAMQVFLLLASNLIAGPLQDKYGPKPLMFTFAILFAFSCCMVSLCHTWWQIFLAQGILQGIALSFGFAPPMACAIAWWKQKSPIAVAVVVSGSSIGGVVWPLIINALLNKVGFAWTWRATALIGLVLILVAMTLVSQPDMFAGNDEIEQEKSKTFILFRYFQRSAKNRPPPRSFFYWDAFKIPAFNSFLASFCFVYLGLFYTFFYLPSWGVLYGMSQSLSFYSISILNATSFFGRLFLPMASFKIGAFNVLFICSLISTIIVFTSIAVDSVAGVLIIGGFYGFWSGGLISMMAPSVASLVSDKSRIGSAVGQLTAACSIFALLGPPISGWLIGAPSDPRKGYNAAQGFSAAVLTIGTILIFVTKLMLNRNPLGKA